MKLAVISFTDKGRITAEQLDKGLKNLGHMSRAFSAHLLKGSLRNFAKTAFENEEGLIFVGAAGIAVRLIAPHLRGKAVDPAVVVVDELGSFAISLLSGHLGGANELARTAASLLGAQPVITTATDLNCAFAVDLFAKQNGLLIDDLKEARAVSAAVLRGEPVGFFSDFPVEGAIPKALVKDTIGSRNIYITCKTEACAYRRMASGELHLLRLIPKAAVLGMGCRKGIPEWAAEKAAIQILNKCGLDKRSVGMLASIDLKQGEQALNALAQSWKIGWKVFTPEQLRAVKGSFSESKFVKSVTGVGNVCERSALAGAGIKGRKAVLTAGRTVFSFDTESGTTSVTGAAAVAEITVKF